MNYGIKIDLTNLLGSNYTNFGVILTENHPQVVPSNLPVHSYPWYPIELGQIPDTFTGYFREKLAVIDPVEAQRMIHDWNTKHIPTANISKQFKVGPKRFTVIDDPDDPGMNIVK